MIATGYYCAKTTAASAQIYSHITVYAASLTRVVEMFCQAAHVSLQDAWTEQRGVANIWDLVIKTGVIGVVTFKNS